MIIEGDADLGLESFHEGGNPRFEFVDAGDLVSLPVQEQVVELGRPSIEQWRQLGDGAFQLATVIFDDVRGEAAGVDVSDGAGAATISGGQ